MSKNSILIVNQHDLIGGAARNSWDLFQGLRNEDVPAYMAVDYKLSDNPFIIPIPRKCPNSFPLSQLLWNASQFFRQYEGKYRGAGRIKFLLQTVASPGTELQKQRGWEDFNFPGSHQILNLFPEQIALVHLHNLHSEYFDLRFLPTLSNRVPTMLTLLDTWLFAGHCGYSLGCDRWLKGCGQCPQISLYSPIKRDASAFNWQRKKEIYALSQLYIATPSQWMGDRLARSILQPAVKEVRVIPSGSDQSVFKPANRDEVREELRLPIDAHILLFVGQGVQSNPFKDYATIEKAIKIVSSVLKDEKILFLCTGNKDNFAKNENTSIRYLPYTLDKLQVARYYQAADIYLHAAHEDTFPNVVLEALSCGVPVIGTAVGGIPEQIVDGKTGFLVAPGNADAMAQQILILLRDKALCREMGLQAFEYARQNFSLGLEVGRYRDYYAHVIETYERH